MGTKTTRLDLLKPGENDYYNQQTEQADNWQKVDDYAVYTDRDKNAIWGGLDGGGLIEDPSVTKVVGKRYIGADGKAYICRVPSNINNSENYTPCNVVDNLDKLQNLVGVRGILENGDLITTYYLNSSFIILQLFIREGSETEFNFRFEMEKILFDLSSLIPEGSKINPFTATIGTLKGITGTYEPLVVRFESKRLISKVPSFSAYCKGSFGTIVIPLI